MSVAAFSGNDTLSINNTILTDLADGDCVTLAFENDIAALKVGKNGNTVYAENKTGKAAMVEMRVIRGGQTDQFLNSLLSLQNGNFAGFVALIGSFVKKVGDAKGNITSDTYPLSGGVFVRNVDGKNNVEGDTNASIAVYKIKFSSAVRAIVS